MISDIEKLSTLVVDDQLTARALLNSLLSKRGFAQIDEVSSALEAADALQAKTYDLVLLDWNLPDGTGFELLKSCRSDRRYDNCAFIIVSAETTDQFIIHALKIGATSYIVKPLMEESFNQHLNKVLIWLSRRKAASCKTAI